MSSECLALSEGGVGYGCGEEGQQTREGLRRRVRTYITRLNEIAVEILEEFTPTAEH